MSPLTIGSGCGNSHTMNNPTISELDVLDQKARLAERSGDRGELAVIRDAQVNFLMRAILQELSAIREKLSR